MLSHQYKPSPPQTLALAHSSFASKGLISITCCCPFRSEIKTLQNLARHSFNRHLSTLFLLWFLITAFSFNSYAQTAPAAASETQRLTAEHLLQLGEVSDPQISPGGDWIAYTVSRDDLEADKVRSRVWMVPAKGGDAIPLTAEDQSSSHPRWSPDAQYLAFTSSRDNKPSQVYRLSRHGGEAIALTKTVQSVSAFEWSPDSKSLVLVLQDASAAELAAADDDTSNDEKAPPPYVIDRHQFKMD